MWLVDCMDHLQSTLRIADTLVHRPMSFIPRVSFIRVLELYISAHFCAVVTVVVMLFDIRASRDIFRGYRGIHAY